MAESIGSQRTNIQADGGRLAELRAVRGWSRLNLASRAECSEGTIARIENGCRTTYTTLVLIAKALRVDVSELIEGNARTRVVMEFTIPDGHFETDEQAWFRLAETIRNVLKPESVFQLESIRRGSIKIRLDISEGRRP